MNEKLAHRSAKTRLIFKQADGTPLSRQPLKGGLTRHAFLFGAGMFDTLEMLDEKADPKRREMLSQRMEKLLKLLNYGTLPFYWGRYEPEEGKPDSQRTLAAAKWLKEKGVTLKGHPLCWHTVCAPWLMAYETPVILEKQLARIRRDVSLYQGLINMWDVINEVVIMPVFDRYDNAVTRLAKKYGQVGLVKMVFDAAHETNPKAELLLNDFNTSPKYEQLIEDCLEAGIPISSIGIQSHQHQGYWGAEKVHDVLSRFSRFDLPIHFTENSLVSGELMPPHIVDLNDWQPETWPSTPEGEDRQARELSEMYTILFQHPQVQAITNWDAVDGKWLGAPTGLLRQDNSEKPAYHALMDLIHRDWHTEVKGQTDENGAFLLEGFKGTYSLTVAGKIREIQVTEDSKEITITV